MFKQKTQTTDPKTALREILEEVRNRQYDNNMHQYDHALAGRLNVLYEDYVKHGGDDANFTATFQPSMICRIGEIEGDAKKILFVEGLRTAFAAHPQFDAIFDELKLFA